MVVERSRSTTIVGWIARGIPGPAAKGTYALLLHLAREAQLDVGRLGRISFPAGYYLYLGSALGGLTGRLARHCRSEKRLRWHIDYLLPHVRLEEIWWEGSEERLECCWAAVAARAQGAVGMTPGFGSSDCRCPSHLVRFAARPRAAILGTASISRLVAAPDALEPILQPSHVGRDLICLQRHRGQAPALRHRART
jgi:Uri superfamily endonuclease